VHPARTVHGDARVPAHVAGAVHDLVRPQARGVRRVVQVPVRTVSEAEVRSALPVDGEAAVHAGPVRPFERLRGHGPASIVGVVYVGPVAEAQMHVVLGVDCHGRVPPRGPIGDALHRSCHRHGRVRRAYIADEQPSRRSHDEERESNRSPFVGHGPNPSISVQEDLSHPAGVQPRR